MMRLGFGTDSGPPEPRQNVCVVTYKNTTYCYYRNSTWDAQDR